ncbi:PspC domain-containing protein [Owenweeksia hongkongensis]|uniref:PspC domain-containing protein n=1 Tax=Owenweeksia hongkongensis (strain DSM 17368 / CIP 108786 / JCM 12287 / NRRL B-23963 / UST20020801) TaxID=926562 RepID=G8R843_OWEHD|nr:PspC domain-containing protein [Owenweeksia hongkongensis]AEV32411.1 PspC domain-containing protein [Owenweeksia hongkongensis DSM 17368]
MIDINEIRDYCERRGFEVCSRMGERMGIAPGVVRMYFIYTSFLAFGSPLIIYLILAFWIKLKDYTRDSRHSVLDL